MWSAWSGCSAVQGRPVDSVPAFGAPEQSHAWPTTTGGVSASDRQARTLAPTATTNAKPGCQVWILGKGGIDKYSIALAEISGKVPNSNLYTAILYVRSFKTQPEVWVRYECFQPRSEQLQTVFVPTASNCYICSLLFITYIYYLFSKERRNHAEIQHPQGHDKVEATVAASSLATTCHINRQQTVRPKWLQASRTMASILKFSRQEWWLQY